MSLKELCTCMTSEFPFPILLSILFDISMGMQFIHSQEIIHRDMSLGNFLISRDFVVQVQIFGIGIF
jgi:serine/threonine protein kinase